MQPLPMTRGVPNATIDHGRTARDGAFAGICAYSGRCGRMDGVGVNVSWALGSEFAVFSDRSLIGTGGVPGTEEG